MKSLLISVALLIINCAAFGQTIPFIGWSFSDKDYVPIVGTMIGKNEISLSYKFPMFDANIKPHVAALKYGRMILLTVNDDDNFSITPSAGIGLYSIKDFSKYDADPTGMTGISKSTHFKPIVGASLARDMFVWRWEISANYCQGFYCTLGFRVFPYQLKNRK